MGHIEGGAFHLLCGSCAVSQFHGSSSEVPRRHPIRSLIRAPSGRTFAPQRPIRSIQFYSFKWTRHALGRSPGSSFFRIILKAEPGRCLYSELTCFQFGEALRVMAQMRGIAHHSPSNHPVVRGWSMQNAHPDSAHSVATVGFRLH